MMKRGLVTVSVIFIAFIFISACTGDNVNQGPPLIDPVATQADSARVTYGDVVAKVIRQGNVRAHTTYVRLESGAGRFGAFYVWPGDEVVAGQLLARMDIAAIEEQIENLEEYISMMRRLHSFDNEGRALEIDMLELTYADAVWAVAEAMDEAAVDGNIILRERIEWARLAHRQAMERQAFDLYDSEIRLSRLRETLAGAEIRAPYNGVITYISAVPGQWLNTWDHILYMVGHEAATFVEYIGDEMTIHQARNARRLRGYVDGMVLELELIELTSEQRLSYSRRNIPPPLRFEILCTEFEAPPVNIGVFIHVYARLYENVLRIPRNALFLGGVYGPYVNRIVAGRKEHVPVSTGFATDTYVAVFTGLQEGDEVFVRP